MAFNIGDHPSSLFRGLSDFWLRFFRDTPDLEAFYQAAEIYLGDAYLDLLSSVLNIGLVDTPIFNKEYWKLFTIREDELKFSEGVNINENRFVYDMPGATADVDVLQNTIFEPDVTLEKDVDLEVLNNDGFIRFMDDLFRYYTDTNGEVLPISGVAWRYLTLLTGNRLTDEKRSTSWYSDSDVQRGDILRHIGYRGNRLAGPHVSDGTMTYVAGTMFFTSVVAPFTLANVGDVLRVYGATSDTFVGHYVIKSYVSAAAVVLEPTAYVPTGSSPANDLSWELYKGRYLDAFEDYAVDYIDSEYLVGDLEKPYPFEAYADLLIYAVVRDVAEPDIIGTNITPSTIDVDVSDDAIIVTDDTGRVQIQVTTGTPFDSATMNKGSKTIADFYWVTLRGTEAITSGIYESYSIYIAAGSPSDTATLDVLTADVTLPSGKYDWRLSKTPPQTDLHYRHIKANSFVPHAQKLIGGILVENEDFSIDYLRGVFSPFRPINPDVVHTCSFQYQKEVTFSASGLFSEYTEGRVKQLSFWVPEVRVDKFNLYYNYGSMLNRFEVSSETYKAFLRGIMYLYMSGPILQRIEAALNVAAGLPVIRNEGEILTAYDDGADDQNTDGQLVDATTNPLYPYAHFITPSHTFEEIDVGGYIVVADALNEVNRGRFRILNVITDNLVEIEAPYGVVNETPLDWVLTRLYKKTVTTNARTYTYDYNVPMREIVEDPLSIGVLSFVAFEPLTEAFRITDYIEDPRWWHNKTIPSLLWPNEVRSRRVSSTQLYEHVIGSVDDAHIGDPGLYIGADDEGNISQVPGAAPLRHNVAFILFDRYLKFHMFYISISPMLELDQQFISDLEDLILVAKPSYTYPYVEPAELLEDMLKLLEAFQEHYGLHYGDDEELELGNNDLVIGGDPERFMSIGDYFRYVDYTAAASGSVSPPAGPFALPIAGTPPAKQHVVKLRLNATIGGSADIGTHDGGDNVPTLVDTSKTWVVDQWLGRVIYNLTDGSSGVIVSNTETEIVATLSGGTDNDWDTSDNYEVGGKQVEEGIDYSFDYDPNVGTPWIVTPKTVWDVAGSVTFDALVIEIVNTADVPIPDTTLGFTPLAIGGTDPGYVRRTIVAPSYPLPTGYFNKMEHIDRTASLIIDADGFGTPYTYP